MHFGILCLLTLIRIFPTEASVYYEYPNHATWTEARNSCSLALPEVWNDLGRNVVNITNAVTTGLWVGYFKAPTGFEYKGCIRNENFTPQMDSKRLTIGQCYSACGRKQIIGIREKNCYCEDQFNYTEGLDSKYCYNSRKCNTTDTIDCNSCDENDCLSIYRVNKNVTKGQTLNNNDDICLKVSGKETVLYDRYTWTDCKQQYRAFCEIDGANFKSPGDENWRESANWCFGSKGHPLNYAKLQERNESTKIPVWTSIINSNVIYTYAEYNNSLSNIRFGYLSSKGSRTVLKFKADMTRQKALCRYDVSTSESETDLATPPPDMSSDSRSMDTNEEQSADNEDFSTSAPEMETTTPPPDMSTDHGFIDTNEEQSADKPDSDVWPIIGASVGSVLLVFGVVVCAVMILKRRNRCKCAHKRTNSHDTSSNCHMTQENYLHDHAVDITKTDTTYDTTCSTKKNKEVETGNIYNKLDTDINATYDHAYNKRKNVAIKAEEVTYDTAEMEALVTKADNKPDRFGDTDEDAYNHINGEQLKTCKTDNVYGISSILGNGAREQGTSNIKDTHSKGDTYSHINNASRKCSKPDNVYGVPNKLHTSSEKTKHQEGDYDVSDKDIQVLDTDNEYSKIGTLS